MKFVLILCMLTSFTVNAHSPLFLPENDLHLYDDINKISGIDEGQFHQIIDSIVLSYSKWGDQLGMNLVADKNWLDSTVNAYAMQEDEGRTWKIAMYGGLARRPEVTADGFAMVVCHELGHHFAGFPIKTNGYWASSEGAADYFATQSCAREIWSQQTEINQTFRDTVDPYVQEMCDSVWEQTNQQNLCYRIAAAGQSLSNLLAILGRQQPPQYQTPDVRQVDRTNTYHPKAQCRMDTFFQGGLCRITHRSGFIPGKGHPMGTLSPQAEHESAANSCYRIDGLEVGARPRCWFAPQLSDKSAG